MKTIERLRELIARVKESPKAFTAKEMDDWSAADAEVYAALPALLAVVEAQQREIEAWRLNYTAMLEAAHNKQENGGIDEATRERGRKTLIGCRESMDATDDALRKLDEVKP